MGKLLRDLFVIVTILGLALLIITMLIQVQQAMSIIGLIMLFLATVFMIMLFMDWIYLGIKGK